jgi:hypothetical protein
VIAGSEDAQHVMISGSFCSRQIAGLQADANLCGRNEKPKSGFFQVRGSDFVQDQNDQDFSIRESGRILINYRRKRGRSDCG